MCHKGVVEIGLDLNSGSRESLLAVIAEQQTIIAELKRRVEKLEAGLGTRGPSAGMPGNKAASKRRRPERRGPRKRRLHGFARRRMEPTRRVMHVPESCPEFGTGLSGDPGLAQWAGTVQELYAKAKTSVAADGRLASRRQLAFEKELLSLCQPFSNDETAPQAKLCRRIERFIRELFVFVSHPDVPPENNAPERSLRHLVISRKISGGTRSERGTSSKMALASLCGTWRSNSLNPLLECCNLLLSPQL